MKKKFIAGVLAVTLAAGSIMPLNVAAEETKLYRDRENLTMVTSQMADGYLKYSKSSDNRPSKPMQNMIKINKERGTFTISWKKVKNAQKIEILRSINGSKFKIWKIEDAEKCKVEFLWKELRKGNFYTFKLRAYRIIDGVKIYSELSNSWAIRIKGTFRKSLMTPEISANKIGNQRMELSWKKVKNAKGYIVYCSEQEYGNYKKIKQTDKSKLLITNLKKGKTYYYKVRAYKKEGKKTVYGDYSNIVVYKMKGKPVTPKQKKIRVDKNKGIFTISWNKISDTEKLQILVSIDGGDYKVWRTVSTEKGKAEYSYRETLKKAHEYSFRLRTYYTLNKKDIYSYLSNAWCILIK